VRAYYSTNAARHNFSCDGCGEDPFVGVRYQCKGCVNYDLCHKCYFDHAHAETEHSFDLHFSRRGEEEDDEVDPRRVVPAHAQGQEEEDEFTFVWWDVDGDGKISLQDLKTSTVLKLNFSANVAEALFTHLVSLDASQGALVSKEVFVQALSAADPAAVLYTPQSPEEKQARKRIQRRAKAAEKRASLDKAAENRAAPKVKNSIWDTSGNGTLEPTGQPEFMPFGAAEKKAEDAAEGKKLLAKDAKALINAAEAGDETKVRQLIACRADLEIATRYGSTPLHFGAKNGQAAVVAALLAAGSLKDAVNQNKKTPLQLALDSGDEADGDEEWKVALKQGKEEVAKMLREAGAIG